MSQMEQVQVDKAKHTNDPEIQRFLRIATADVKEEYNQIKGRGSYARKRDFRDMIHAQKLKNLTAAQTNVASSTEQQSVVWHLPQLLGDCRERGGLNGQVFWHKSRQVHLRAL